MKPARILVLFCLSLSAEAAEPTMGPVFERFGPTFAIEDRDMALPEGFLYKAVFDLAKSPDDKATRSSYIESVARFINMHARSGVPLDKMRLAVVMHGPATKNALSHTAYRKRYGIDNPNLAMIDELEKAGVTFYLCGQSAEFSGIKREELASSISVSLSAMTALVLLQGKGYALLP